MDYLQRYEVKKLSLQSDEFELVLYLDGHMTEFAAELGTIPKPRKDILSTAKKIINDRYPGLKVTMVKVIIGGMVVSSLPLLSDSASAATVGPIGNTTQVTEVEQNSIYYKVVAGDNLWNLSAKYQTSVDNIKKANNLTSDILRINQRLIIPKAFHTVKAGDYLTVLAKQYGVSVSAIKQANHLTSDATKLGQTLIIPIILNDASTIASPPPTETATTPAQTDSTYYVVPGDSLSVIAKRFGTSVDVLRSANQLTSDVLQIGQPLTIPGTGTLEIPPIQREGTYTVVAGDSLSVIAKRFGTSVEALKSTNQLTSELLRIGQNLIIPAGATGTPPIPKAQPAPILEQTTPVLDETIDTTEDTTTPDETADTIEATPATDGTADTTEATPAPNEANDTNEVIPAPDATTDTTEASPIPGDTATTGSTYTVVSGDYLWAIATKFGTSIGALKSANNLTSDELRIGQTLLIPSNDTSAQPVAPTPATPAPNDETTDTTEATPAPNEASDTNEVIPAPDATTDTTEAAPIPGDTAATGSTYSIVSGDNLWAIATKFGTSIGALKSANNLTSDELRIGQTLLIPSNDTSSQPVAPTPATPAPNDETTDTTEATPAPNEATDTSEVPPEPDETTDTTEAAPTPSDTATTGSPYTVVSGDNLWAIATKFGISIGALKSANNLTSDELRIGQTLLIPSNDTSAQPVTPTPATPAPNDETTDTTEATPPPDEAAATGSPYTVVSGDNLWAIATKFGTSIGALKSANNLTSDELRIGQRLLIPTGETSTQPVAPTPTPENEEGVATPAPIAEETRSTFIYGVRSGDTQSAIAQRFGVTVEAIRAANYLNSDYLSVGQALTIPNGINAPAQTGANTISYITHTVVSGDNIWKLSILYGVPQTELLRANNLTTSSVLNIGQKLTVPVHNIAVKEVVSERHGEYLDWWTEAQYIFTINKTAKVTDVLTGKSFNITRTIGANHADSETTTLSDTNIAKSIWGGFSWTPRAVILEVDGRKMAASMSFMPHEREYITGNGITGHFDVYFGNSTRHKDGAPDFSHQAQVERAAGLR